MIVVTDHRLTSSASGLSTSIGSCPTSDWAVVISSLSSVTGNGELVGMSAHGADLQAATVQVGGDVVAQLRVTHFLPADQAPASHQKGAASSDGAQAVEAGFAPRLALTGLAIEYLRLGPISSTSISIVVRLSPSFS